MDRAFFQQITRNIQSLIIEGRLNDALIKCHDVLQRYPDDNEVKELMEVIAEKLEEENKEKVKIGIDEVKKMIKENKNEDALRKLQELLTLSPNNLKLKKLYIKEQDKYKEKFLRAEKNFLETKEKELRDLLESERYPEYLKELYSLESEYRKNRKIQSLVFQMKELIIQREIEGKRDLLKTTKFQDIESFLSDLRRINKDSLIIRDLETKINKRKIGTQVEGIGDFIYTGEQSLISLMKLKKYDEAMEVCREILDANPDNKKVQATYLKAKSKSFFKERKEAVKNVKKLIPALKQKYENHKELYASL